MVLLVTEIWPKIRETSEELKKEIQTLDTFVTLSPVPGFRKWLLAADLDDPEGGWEEEWSLQMDDEEAWFDYCMEQEETM